jgi:hypothetical protein
MDWTAEDGYEGCRDWEDEDDVVDWSRCGDQVCQQCHACLEYSSLGDFLEIEAARID